VSLPELIWHTFSDVASILACTYCLLHVLLPNRFIHPLKLTVSCKEEGCKWAKTFNDRSEGDHMPLKLLDKMREAHKAHFLKEHPGEEWPG